MSHGHFTYNDKTYDLDKRKDLVSITNVLYRKLEQFYDNNLTETWGMLHKIIKDGEKNHQRFRPTSVLRAVTLAEATRHFVVVCILGGLSKLHKGVDMRQSYIRLDHVLGQVLATDEKLQDYLKEQRIDEWMCYLVEAEFDYCVLSGTHDSAAA
jgi:hypothetical protein